MTRVYLDTEDFFYPAFSGPASGVPYYYRIGNLEFSIEPYGKTKDEMVTVEQILLKAKHKPKAKVKRDWTSISSIILALSMIGFAIGYTVYTAIEVLFN